MGNLRLFFLIILSLVNLFLGILVLLKGRKSIVNLSFFLLVLTVIFWGVFNYICDEPTQFHNAIFWNRATIAIGFIQCVFAIYFVLTFLNQTEKKLHVIWKTIFFIYGITAVITLTTNLIVQNIEILRWGTNIVGGKLYFLYPPLIFFAITVILFLLIKNYKSNKDEKKRQIGYILFGIIGYLSIVIPLSVLLPVITKSNEYAKFSPYAWVFFLFFTALAITRYHLFGIEVILTELMVVVIALLLIIQIFMAPTLLWRIINGILFVLFCFFGYLLIKATFREIKRRQEIEKIDKAKSEFISIASHQLRTPLTAVKGYISMIMEGIYGQLPEKMS